MVMRPRIASALALLLAAGEARHVLDKYPHFRCSACKVVAKTLFESKKTLTEKEVNPIQVSHRLGDGKWDHHGDGGVKKVKYANSEIMAIEVVEHACDKARYNAYQIRLNEDKQRVFTADKEMAKGESYDKYDKNILDAPEKMLAQQCSDLAHDHEEELHGFLRAKETLEEFETMCLGGIPDVAYCKKETQYLKDEVKSHAKWEKEEQAKVDKKRAKGVKRFSLGDVYFKHNDVAVSFDDIGATVVSESTHQFPNHTKAEHVLDSNRDTRMTDTKGQPFWVSFNATVTVDAYGWATSDDNAENDPVRWVLQVLRHNADNASAMVEHALLKHPYPDERAIDDSADEAYPAMDRPKAPAPKKEESEDKGDDEKAEEKEKEKEEKEKEKEKDSDGPPPKLDDKSSQMKSMGLPAGKIVSAAALLLQGDPELAAAVAAGTLPKLKIQNLSVSSLSVISADAAVLMAEAQARPVPRPPSLAQIVPKRHLTPVLGVVQPPVPHGQAAAAAAPAAAAAALTAPNLPSVGSIPYVPSDDGADDLDDDEAAFLLEIASPRPAAAAAAADDQPAAAPPVPPTAPPSLPVVPTSPLPGTAAGSASPGVPVPPAAASPVAAAAPDVAPAAGASPVVPPAIRPACPGGERVEVMVYMSYPDGECEKDVAERLMDIERRVLEAHGVHRSSRYVKGSIHTVHVVEVPQGKVEGLNAVALAEAINAAVAADPELKAKVGEGMISIKVGQPVRSTVPPAPAPAPVPSVPAPMAAAAAATPPPRVYASQSPSPPADVISREVLTFTPHASPQRAAAAPVPAVTVDAAAQTPPRPVARGGSMATSMSVSPHLSSISASPKAPSAVVHVMPMPALLGKDTHQHIRTWLKATLEVFGEVKGLVVSLTEGYARVVFSSAAEGGAAVAASARGELRTFAKTGALAVRNLTEVLMDPEPGAAGGFEDMPQGFVPPKLPGAATPAAAPLVPPPTDAAMHQKQPIPTPATPKTPEVAAPAATPPASLVLTPPGTQELDERKRQSSEIKSPADELDVLSMANVPVSKLYSQARMLVVPNPSGQFTTVGDGGASPAADATSHATALATASVTRMKAAEYDVGTAAAKQEDVALLGKGLTWLTASMAGVGSGHGQDDPEVAGVHMLVMAQDGAMRALPSGTVHDANYILPPWFQGAWDEYPPLPYGDADGTGTAKVLHPSERCSALADADRSPRLTRRELPDDGAPHAARLVAQCLDGSASTDPAAARRAALVRNLLAAADPSALLDDTVRLLLANGAGEIDPEALRAALTDTVAAAATSPRRRVRPRSLSPAPAAVDRDRVPTFHHGTPQMYEAETAAARAAAPAAPVPPVLKPRDLMGELQGAAGKAAAFKSREDKDYLDAEGRWRQREALQQKCAQEKAAAAKEKEYEAKLRKQHQATMAAMEKEEQRAKQHQQQARAGRGKKAFRRTSSLSRPAGGNPGHALLSFVAPVSQNELISFINGTAKPAAPKAASPPPRGRAPPKAAAARSQSAAAAPGRLQRPHSADPTGGGRFWTSFWRRPETRQGLLADLQKPSAWLDPAETATHEATAARYMSLVTTPTPRSPIKRIPKEQGDVIKHSLSYEDAYEYWSDGNSPPRSRSTPGRTLSHIKPAPSRQGSVSPGQLRLQRTISTQKPTPGVSRQVSLQWPAHMVEPQALCAHTEPAPPVDAHALLLEKLQMQQQYEQELLLQHQAHEARRDELRKERCAFIAKLEASQQQRQHFTTGTSGLAEGGYVDMPTPHTDRTVDWGRVRELEDAIETRAAALHAQTSPAPEAAPAAVPAPHEQARADLDRMTRIVLQNREREAKRDAETVELERRVAAARQRRAEEAAAAQPRFH
eukprot:TRINITY_DN175_c1_g1_i1.p1 TRINITY_DN175_c1_g1~~TRINITY_DN175_c1_g1_i1.p1  ORF type:complete len:1852 (+),score=709.41 TRINITY_DN175_c1_g1_i1:65-5620(+)